MKETQVGAVVYLFLLVFGSFWFANRKGSSKKQVPIPKPEETDEQRLVRAKNNEQRKKQQELEGRALLLRTSEIERLSAARLASWDVVITATPYQFESIVANVFERHGYVVKQTPRTSDGGKDIIVVRNGKKQFVECKRYDRENLITTPILRNFLGAMASEGIESGIFVTTSDFNENALEFAKNNNIVTINGERIVAAISKLVESKSPIDSFMAICTSCGEVGTFPLLAEIRDTRCRCGAAIRYAIATKDLTLSSLAYRQREERCPECDSHLIVNFGYRGNPIKTCKDYPRCGFKKGFR